MNRTDNHVQKRSTVTWQPEIGEKAIFFILQNIYCLESDKDVPIKAVLAESLCDGTRSIMKTVISLIKGVKHDSDTQDEQILLEIKES